MKSRLLPDLLGPADDFLDTIGAEIHSIFRPHAVPGEGNPLGDGPVAILGTPALTSEAALASSAQSGPSSVVAMVSGGITINLLFDAAAMAAPASFRVGIQQAASLLTAAISDQITVNIKIDYSGTGGGAAAGPDAGQFVSYSSVRSDLINGATPGDPTFNALPAGSSIQGQSSVAVWNAQLKLFGLLGANDTTTDDGSATFATDISSNLLVGVALHELTHAMGRVPYGPPYGSQPDIFDFFRFTSSGTQLISGSATAQAAYFSVDGGHTKLADYGMTSDPADFLNSGVQGPNDPLNEFYSGSTIQALSAADKAQLDALGFHLAVTTTVIESIGSTNLTQVGSNFFLFTGGTGSELKYSGAPVTAGEFGAWTPIGTEQTSSGYEVAWKTPGADQYTVWNTDGSGNFVVNNIGVVPGNSNALESLETSFHQDLNGDGVIGLALVSGTVIESSGLTSLTQVGNNFFLITGGTGPELNYSGAPVTAGEFGAWTPIGTEQTSSGYEVAWKTPGADQYTVWNTDGSGNFFVNNIGVVPGNSNALESLENSFHQDLNGDGVIGLPTVSGTVIEAFGLTSLTQVGQNFFLFTGGTGPELKYSGAPVTAGEFGAWTPIGTEQTSSGYEVAWKTPGADQYTVWNTDGSGNFVANNIGVVPGNSNALESLETSFHQDLNGDGVIGLPSTAIESFGLTSLTQVGNNFFLITGGTGPELKYSGAPVTAGEFGAWTPIGTEQTSSGYEVAWKTPGADQYTVWNTDGSGNFFVNNIGVVPGNSNALESLENSFHQDLNGDGTIGVPGLPTSGASPLLQQVSGEAAHPDTFVFKPGIGDDVISNATGADTIELEGFSSVLSNAYLAALLHDAQTGQPQNLFQSTNGGRDTVLDLGNHDILTLVNVPLSALHANGFIVH